MYSLFRDSLLAKTIDNHGRCFKTVLLYYLCKMCFPFNYLRLLIRLKRPVYVPNNMLTDLKYMPRGVSDKCPYHRAAVSVSLSVTVETETAYSVCSYITSSNFYYIKLVQRLMLAQARNNRYMISD